MRNRFTSTPALAAYAAAVGAMAPTAADAGLIDATLRHTGGFNASGFNGSGGPIIATATSLASPSIEISGLPGTDGFYYNLDIDGDGTDDFWVGGTWSADSSAVLASIGTIGSGGVFVEYNGKVPFVMPIAAGTTIGPDLEDDATGREFNYFGWLFSETRTPDSLIPFNELVYIGLQFDAGNDGLLNYGYLQLIINANSPVSGYTIQGGVFQSANNTAITTPAATAVPEPGTLSLLAAGAVGLAALRRRRKTRAAA